jgi:hypothetical protein
MYEIIEHHSNRGTSRAVTVVQEVYTVETSQYNPFERKLVPPLWYGEGGQHSHYFPSMIY